MYQHSDTSVDDPLQRGFNCSVDRSLLSVEPPDMLMSLASVSINCFYGVWPLLHPEAKLDFDRKEKQMEYRNRYRNEIKLSWNSETIETVSKP
ncbi:hypothetical protein HNY73_018813 [Argiope bruennichi]|uniref:Uncharacterized protein n=1 Tax=Argiope bruennichi TaxID=94029 RepID=A0A8T0EF99_ARGBR|nr:hypothetical protein HNY73_018813 [Argiope bruennichi]